MSRVGTHRAARLESAALPLPHAVMNRGNGIQLTTGETIGRWSLDDMDGRREAPQGAEEPQARRLPAAAEQNVAEPVADAFADRMMENLMYKRMKLQAKGLGTARGESASLKPSSTAAVAVASGALPTKMMVKESGGEVSASVEETNRVRALLGMPPLSGTGPPAAASAPQASGAEREHGRAADEQMLIHEGRREQGRAGAKSDEHERDRDRNRHGRDLDDRSRGRGSDDRDHDSRDRARAHGRHDRSYDGDDRSRDHGRRDRDYERRDYDRRDYVRVPPALRPDGLAHLPRLANVPRLARCVTCHLCADCERGCRAGETATGIGATAVTTTATVTATATVIAIVTAIVIVTDATAIDVSGAPRASVNATRRAAAIAPAASKRVGAGRSTATSR